MGWQASANVPELLTRVHAEHRSPEHKLWLAVYVDGSIVAGASGDIAASEKSKILEGLPGLEIKPDTENGVDRRELLDAHLEYSALYAYPHGRLHRQGSRAIQCGKLLRPPAAPNSRMKSLAGTLLCVSLMHARIYRSRFRNLQPGWRPRLTNQVEQENVF